MTLLYSEVVTSSLQELPSPTVSILRLLPQLLLCTPLLPTVTCSLSLASPSPSAMLGRMMMVGVALLSTWILATEQSLQSRSRSMGTSEEEMPEMVALLCLRPCTGVRTSCCLGPPTSPRPGVIRKMVR